MKILCDRQQLQEAFATVAGIAPQKTPKPIIKNVHLEAHGDSLVLFATDMDLSAVVRLDTVKVTEPGTVLLPARETSALLREIADPTVSLESKDDRCTLEGGGGSFVLVGDDPDQFPAKQELVGGTRVSLPAAALIDMVKKTMFAAAKEETRYAINGVLFDCKDSALQLVATDGRRLALAYRNLEDPEVSPAQAIVPVRTLQALTRSFSEDGDAVVEIAFGDNQVGFTIGSTQLVSQLLDNRFPEYEAVVPRTAESTIEISRDLLERNLRRVAILSSGDVRLVKFAFSGSQLEMTAESSGVGRADLRMDVLINGPGGEIGFNPDFLLEALRVADLEMIRLDMTDGSTPAKLTMAEAFTYVVMPVSS